MNINTVKRAFYPDNNKVCFVCLCGKEDGEEEITLLAHPAKYDGNRPGIRLPPQALGAQTNDILGELGYTADQIGKLSDTGIIHQS